MIIWSVARGMRKCRGLNEERGLVLVVYRPMPPFPQNLCSKCTVPAYHFAIFPRATMTDTFTRARDSLISALSNTDNKVTVLKGNWGSGKTYLWERVEAKFSNDSRPIYVSIFGAKTINDLKLRIIQSAYLKDKERTEKLAKNVGNVLTGLAQRFLGFNATEAALLWLPNLISNRLIIIDDVERKHKLLEIDEILGLLDEYSEGHGTKFLILLNTDKLADATDLWNAMHEKVIDAEIVLNPSAEESFDVAAEGSSLKYLSNIRAAIAVLNINNIRVIKKIINTVRKLSKSSGLDDAPPERWIPSTVLLTAIHYRTVENPPTIEFIQEFSSISRSLAGAEEQEGDNERAWSRMLNRLGINFADDFEVFVYDYLQSGIIDSSRLDKIVAGYARDLENILARNLYDDYFESLFWDTTVSKEDLLEKARVLLNTVNVMSPADVSNIARSIEESLGDKTLANKFIDAWIAEVETRPEFQNMDERDFKIPRSIWHPKIIDCLTQIRDKQHPPLSLIEAISRILETSSWGLREWTAFERSTAAQYEYELEKLTGEPLRRFVAKHIIWIENGPPDEFAKGAMENFVEACARICTYNSKSRLAFVIKTTFAAEKIEDMLIKPIQFRP